jgi:hypothetical protein
MLFHLQYAHVGLRLAATFGKEMVVAEKFLPEYACQFEIVNILEGYLD